MPTITEQVSSVLCHYQNNTAQIQVVCLLAGDRPLLEKVIFPCQRFLFEASPTDTLEVREGQSLGDRPAQQFTCLHLQVSQK